MRRRLRWTPNRRRPCSARWRTSWPTGPPSSSPTASPPCSGRVGLWSSTAARSRRRAPTKACSPGGESTPTSIGYSSSPRRAMPNREAAWRRWAPSLVAALIRGVGKTLRIDTVNSAAIEARWLKGEAVIIAFWHGRQLMLPLAYHGRGLSILISRHRDGELIARAMRAFGFSSVRGSTTRGGSSALRALVAEGRRGGGGRGGTHAG